MHNQLPKHCILIEVLKTKIQENYQFLTRNIKQYPFQISGGELPGQQSENVYDEILKDDCKVQSEKSTSCFPPHCPKKCAIL